MISIAQREKFSYTKTDGKQEDEGMARVGIVMETTVRWDPQVPKAFLHLAIDLIFSTT